MEILPTRAGVLQCEVLILELVAIDGFASSAIVVCEVSSLAHEVGDDTVESAALVAKSLLSSAKGSEVLSCLGHYVGAQLKPNKNKIITVSKIYNFNIDSIELLLFKVYYITFNVYHVRA